MGENSSWGRQVTGSTGWCVDRLRQRSKLKRFGNNIFRLACKPHSVQRSCVGLHPEGFRPNTPPVRSSLCAAYPGLLTTRAASCPCLALLLAGVTWPPALLQTPVVSYTAFSPSPSCDGSLFLWPDPADCSAPGFPRRHALWSADFPRPFAEARGRDRPASLKTKVSYRLSKAESTGAVGPQTGPVG